MPSLLGFIAFISEPVCWMPLLDLWASFLSLLDLVPFIHCSHFYTAYVTSESQRAAAGLAGTM